MRKEITWHKATLWESAAASPQHQLWWEQHKSYLELILPTYEVVCAASGHRGRDQRECVRLPGPELRAPEGSALPPKASRRAHNQGTSRGPHPAQHQKGGWRSRASLQGCPGQTWTLLFIPNITLAKPIARAERDINVTLEHPSPSGPTPEARPAGLVSTLSYSSPKRQRPATRGQLWATGCEAFDLLVDRDRKLGQGPQVTQGCEPEGRAPRLKPITDTVTKEWTILPVVGGSPSPELPILPSPPYRALLGLYHMRDCELPKEKSTDGPPVRASGRTLPQRVKIHGVPPLLRKVTTQQEALFPLFHILTKLVPSWSFGGHFVHRETLQIWGSSNAHQTQLSLRVRVGTCVEGSWGHFTNSRWEHWGEEEPKSFSRASQRPSKVETPMALNW